jgi:beta-lactamase class A
MKRVWRLGLVPAGVLGVTIAIYGLYPSLSLAPSLEEPYGEAPLLVDRQPIDGRSLEELYTLRDRLRQQLEQPSAMPTMVQPGVFATPTRQLEILQAVEIQIQIEETANEYWEQALNSATEALALRDQPDQSKTTYRQVYTLWQTAIDALERIPDRSLRSPDVPAKITEYQSHLARAAYNYDTARSEFLEEIARGTGLEPNRVFITVCNLAGECRRWNGSTRPASPASLIKVPVAVALMQKVIEEDISLETKLMVSRGNFTEDASDIWVGKEYTLRTLMRRMINQSSNIATNQLIDYLGMDYINQVMRDRGYEDTSVGSKLVGQTVVPANLGGGANTITTDDLTEMMRQIYAQENPGDGVLLEALASQYDTVMGYDGLRNTHAFWMGEKPGQNSKALGTTVAFLLEEEMYFATVVLNYSANERAVRTCISDIAKYLTEHGGFGG